MATTVAFRESARAVETGEVWRSLVTLTHASFGTRRIVAGRRQMSSRGNTWAAYPMQLVLPRDTDEGALDGQIDIDDVGRTLIDALRGANSYPSVLIEVVRTADPDTVEFAYSDYELRDATFADVRISGSIALADQRTEEMSHWSATPTIVPGLF